MAVDVPLSPRLSQAFFNRPTVQVARDLLGAQLVHIENGTRLAGTIIETEAYVGEADLGCHAKAGRTPRTAVMYGPPGRAYVYFTYGMHWLFNCITEEEGFPAAVLIRAMDPTDGVEIMARRRGSRPRREWTNGPAKLTQALGIGSAQNALDLCAPDSSLFLEPGEPIPDERVTTTPRVGLYTVPEPWKSIPWRFLAR
ncbi:MAG TPA: DNA-3-methyladenine glycosylase [Anaerolineales bacterium]|nr:DNA-3-methyladenine glycosylase [Anaerolineales bacterium]